MRILKGVKQAIQTMAFSPDGTQLAVGGSAARVHLWSLEDGRATSMLGTGGPFVAVAFWRDTLLAIVNKGDVRARELASGEERTLATGLMFITHAVVAPAQQLLIVAGGDRRWQRGLWTWALPDLVPAWDFSRPYGQPGAYSLAISPDGRTLAAGGDSGVTLHDPSDGTHRELVGTTTNVRRLAFSPDGRHLAAAVENRLFVWDARTGAERANITAGRKHFMSVAFHPDGRLLAAANTDHTVRLFDTATWSQVSAFDWEVGRVDEVVFSPDGMRAAVGSAGGQIVLWDVDG